MSRKNHKKIDGRLLQTDKKYSNLKFKQKEKIYAWMFEETKIYHDRNGKCPEKKEEDEVIVDAVYDRSISLSLDNQNSHCANMYKRI